MKISIFSDCHCGYAYGTERGEDAFLGLEEAIDKSLDCDLILMAGDIFDTRIPRPEVFSRAARILSKSQSVQSKAKFVEINNKEKHEISPLALRGIPIVAIHGTHERRSKHLVNPIQALEHAGLLIHLNCSTAVFEIDDKKVAVHGMSGVPDRYAGDILKEWNPKPVLGAINILMIHQSVDPYIYSPLEPPTISLDSLPKGFDLYILGHIHWSEIRDLKGGKLILAGSTTFTSLHKTEAIQQKYIYHFNGEVRKVPLDSQRKVFWNELEYNQNIKNEIENALNKVPKLSPKPITVFKIKGTLPKDSAPIDFSDIEKKYSDRTIIKIDRNLKTESLKDQVELIRMLKEQKLSPEEHGLRILEENLKQLNCGINAQEIFDLLVEGDTENIFNLLVKK